ncbi:hypothetical protein RAE21_14660 [Rhodoferax sp. TBRC 17198]|jgi:hypothetical protein|uniref:hypothetical protein n=1 Tax=Rhodoferax potami TaxID=3068338 RepID=UPI0028BEA1D8|nr:hypothetical protein [Rhodoferax sp. TBRC 17198]MDT7523631.1 hypothetical protein [Rhodoferax sp. TBRC 17198]
MNHPVFAVALCASLTSQAFGQEAISLTRLPSGAAPSLNQSDRSLLDKAVAERKSIGLLLHNTVVAFDTRYDGARKKIGVSLTSFSNSPLELAYDPTGKSLIAQWRSVHTTAAGQSFQYQAFVGESGAINFVVSSKF